MMYASSQTPGNNTYIENMFRDVAEVEVYIDDICIFSDSWEQHLSVLYIKLQKLQENGFTVNP